MFGTALLLYAAVVLYLFSRGVERRLILRIVTVAAGVGLGFAIIISVLVGAFRDVLGVCAMVALLYFAAYYARSQILGAITPLGIILLNVAANLAPADGPMALTFAWVASVIPLPYGPLRVGLNLLVLYSPGLMALFLLVQGPPGSPLLRYVLGGWVCWVGIAAVTGPGWQMIKDFHYDQPIDWLAAALVAYAALHVTMLALNLVISLADERDGPRSMARTVRVDRMNPVLALGLGLAFFAAARAFLARSGSDDFKTGTLIAAAFIVASVLAPRRVPIDPAEEAGMHATYLPKVGLAIYFAALVGGALYWSWGFNPATKAKAVRVDPATGMAARQKESVPTPNDRMKSECRDGGKPC